MLNLFKKKQEVILLIGVITLVILARFLWIFFGNEYTRISLIGTEYIENSDELFALEKDQQQKYYLIKKYKHSEDVLLIGFGGGGSRTDDYYGLGIADADKQPILKPNYAFIYAKQDHKTKAVYIHCVPYRKTGLEPDEFYKIENNKAILLPDRKY